MNQAQTNCTKCKVGEIILPCWGERGNKTAAPWPGLGVGLEEIRICCVKERLGERHSRQKQQPEQGFKGSAEHDLCVIKEGRKVTAARSRRTWATRGFQLQRECGLALRVFV